MGKNYVNRKRKEDRPESDFYQTPYILTEKLINILENEKIDKSSEIYEPAVGNFAIVKILNKYGFNNIITDDIRITKKDFLECNKEYDYIITNPPFSIFDKFILKCQEICKKKYILLIKTNFFGAKQRYLNGIWKYLKGLYIFNRQVDYRWEPEIIKYGCLVTGWAVFDKEWTKDFWMTKIIDI